MLDMMDVLDVIDTVDDEGVRMSDDAAAQPKEGEMSTKDVMALLKVSRATLSKWAKSGKLVPIPLPPYIDKGPRFYREDDVKTLMEGKQAN